MPGFDQAKLFTATATRLTASAAIAPESYLKPNTAQKFLLCFGTLLATRATAAAACCSILATVILNTHQTWMMKRTVGLAMTPSQRSLPRADTAQATAAASSKHAQRLTVCLVCRSYEDYLDSQITGTDMYYLEDLELARQLVELG